MKFFLSSFFLLWRFFIPQENENEPFPSFPKKASQKHFFLRQWIFFFCWDTRHGLLVGSLINNLFPRQWTATKSSPLIFNFQPKGHFCGWNVQLQLNCLCDTNLTFQLLQTSSNCNCMLSSLFILNDKVKTLFDSFWTSIACNNYRRIKLNSYILYVPLTQILIDVFNSLKSLKRGWAWAIKKVELKEINDAGRDTWLLFDLIQSCSFPLFFLDSFVLTNLHWRL